MMKNQQFEIEAIIKAVNVIFDINLTANKKSQKRHITDGRRIYALIARKHTPCGLIAIGSYIGKDHSSVIHYLKTGAQILESDHDFKKKYKNCEAFLMHSYYDFRKEKLLSNFSDFKTDFKALKTPFIAQIESILNSANIN